MADVKKLFQNEEAKQVERPTSGSVDLLIGFSYAAYHPVKVEGVGHLLFMRNRFGGLIAGSHSTIQKTTKKLVKHAIVHHSVANIEEFHSIESLKCYLLSKMWGLSLRQVPNRGKGHDDCGREGI